MTEIKIPVKSLELFVEDSLKNVVIDQQKNIRSIVGKYKSDPNGSMVTQSFIFDQDKYDEEDAEKWVDEHEKISDNFFGTNEIINLSEDDEGEKPMTTKVKKQYVCELKDFNEEERSFTAIASTSSVDRDGDILEAKGVRLKNFKKNPLLLWSHDASQLPIGRVESVWVEGDKVYFKPKFAPAELNPFADQVYKMYKEKYIRAFSIRFDPIEYKDIQDDANNRSIRRFGKRFTQFELLEISAVNVPSNPEALKEKSYQNFIVKSAQYENGLNSEIKAEKQMLDAEETKKTNESIEQKKKELEELKKVKEDFEELMEFEAIEKSIDDEIAKLKEEIEVYRLMEKVKSLSRDVQNGITILESNEEDK